MIMSTEYNPIGWILYSASFEAKYINILDAGKKGSDMTSATWRNNMDPLKVKPGTLLSGNHWVPPVKGEAGPEVDGHTDGLPQSQIQIQVCPHARDRLLNFAESQPPHLQCGCSRALSRKHLKD